MACPHGEDPRVCLYCSFATVGAQAQAQARMAQELVDLLKSGQIGLPGNNGGATVPSNHLSVQIQPVHHPSLGACYAVRFVYDKAKVEEFKLRTTSAQRLWDPHKKVWFLKATHAEIGRVFSAMGYPDPVLNHSLVPDMDSNPPPGAPIHTARPRSPWTPPNKGVWGAAIPPPPSTFGRTAPPPKAAPPKAAPAKPADDNFFKRKYATPEDYAALHLLPTAPVQVCKAAYRAMALLSHPDAGGTNDAVARVNKAWERIEKAHAAG